MKLIDKDTLVAEIEKMKNKAYPNSEWNHGYVTSCEKLLSFINTLDVKEETEIKLLPSKQQLKALKDLLDYNIGVFDYQKFMEVYSFYNDLIKYN